MSLPTQRTAFLRNVLRNTFAADSNYTLNCFQFLELPERTLRTHNTFPFRPEAGRRILVFVQSLESDRLLLGSDFQHPGGCIGILDVTRYIDNNTERLQYFADSTRCDGRNVAIVNHVLEGHAEGGWPSLLSVLEGHAEGGWPNLLRFMWHILESINRAEHGIYYTGFACTRGRHRSMCAALLFCYMAEELNISPLLCVQVPTHRHTTRLCACNNCNTLVNLC